jgi:hypothetical protein
MQTTQMACEGKEYWVSDKREIYWHIYVPEIVAACDVCLTEQGNEVDSTRPSERHSDCGFRDSFSSASHKCLN